MAFMTLAFAQVLHLGNARSGAAVLAPASVLSNRWALAGASLAILLQVVAIAYAPLREVLHLVWLSPRDWAVVIACAAVPAIAGQALKVLRPRAARG